MKWMAFLVMVGCEGVRGNLDPPENPPHDVIEHGYRHGRGLDTPYLCGLPSRDGFRRCEDGIRPLRENLSCDASGCHGDFEYGLVADPVERHLSGSDGPSCFSCHNREWSEQGQ